jgi:two-component system, cell cycle response regulator
MEDINDTGVRRRLFAPMTCHVLVVDDNESTRMHLVSLLRLAGYDVHSASSGEEALIVLAAMPCQIVLTNYTMPGMDGLALCRALRLRDSEHYTYVLMMTVQDDKGDILVGLGAGADDCLAKGASAEEFLARVEVGRRITHLEHSLRASGEENHRLSLTDPLTGARNRRFLMKYLPRELERARRYGRPLAILSCDIDAFKRINDTFGHEAGDQVLQAFVSRAAACLRESIDWIARAGGEEFVIVLPETPLNGASRVAEKLRLAMAGQAVPTGAGPLSATVSIGVTALETPQERANISVAELLRAADQCLYVSKNLGRDRTTCVPAARAAAVMNSALAGAKHEIN